MKRLPTLFRTLCAAGLLCAALALVPLTAEAAAPPVQRATGTVRSDVELDYPASVQVSASLPSRYDGREQGLVTPIRDQGQNGLCWDFAALGAMESNLLKNGLGYQDLSEIHMAYATSDHSGNTAQGFSRDPGDGGNCFIAACYLMRGTSLGGTVMEYDDPYQPEELPDRSLSITESKSKAFAAGEIPFFGREKDSIQPAVIKEAVMNYGAVGASMDMDQSFSGDYGYHYINEDTGAYYYSDGTGWNSNHDVVIVGWDDDYSVNNFNSFNRPSHPGAWLVKNSWGPFGDNGYLWISYEDTAFPQDCYAVGGTRAVDYAERVYETDHRSYGYASHEHISGLLASRVYQTASDGEAVRRLILFLPYPAGHVDVDVVPDFTGFEDYAFQVRGGLDMQFPGWYTVDLYEPVALGVQGSSFAVVVRFSDEASALIGADQQTNAAAGSAFYQSADSGWRQTISNMTIRAVTGPAPAAPTPAPEPNPAPVPQWDGVTIDNAAGQLMRLNLDRKGSAIHLGNFSDADLEKLTGDLHVDLTVLDERVTSAHIPANLVEYLALNGGKAKSLTLSFHAGAVTLDTTAMFQIYQRTGETVELTVAPLDPSQLSAAQKRSVEGDIYPGVRLGLSDAATGEVINTLNGGRLTVQIPLSLPAGAEGTEFSVRKLSGASATRFRSFYLSHAAVFRTGSPCADYIVEHEGPAAWFSDVTPGTRDAGTVAYVSRERIMIGMGENRFVPEGHLTRAMVAQIFFNLEQGEKTASSFTDVGADMWYAGAVGWAERVGVINGYGDGRFGPEDEVTIEQLATMLNNFAKYKGYDVSLTTDSIITASSWAQDAYRWITAGGFFEADSSLNGTDVASRIRVATAVTAFLESYVL